MPRALPRERFSSLAHRIGSLQRGNSVAFRLKRIEGDPSWDSERVGSARI
jgi:hypothetical protein